MDLGLRYVVAHNTLILENLNPLTRSDAIPSTTSGTHREPQFLFACDEKTAPSDTFISAP